MTREVIMKLEGYELDIAVAEKVMGIIFPTVEKMKQIAEDQWKVQPSCRDFYMGFYAWEEDGEFKWRYKTKNYSTDIASAWEVLNKLIEKGAEINVGYYEKWDCSIDYPIGCNWCEQADTAPLAICRAALIAVMEATQ